MCEEMEFNERVFVSGNLMNVDEKGVEQLKGESYKKRNGCWLFLIIKKIN